VTRVLITGGGGYVGTLVARRLLAAGAPLVLWLSARDAAEAGARQARAAAAIGIAPDDRRVAWAHGDLRDAKPFASTPCDGVSHVIHAAAVTRFNVEADLAEAINHQGTRKALAFAADLPGLERFIQVSTIFATGLAPGDVPEAPAPTDIAFANHYEASKHRAEHAAAACRVPLAILRLATIVADTDDGAPIGQVNAVHNTLKLLRYGLLPLIPGRPETQLALITGALAAEAIAKALTAATLPPVVHVAHRREQSLTVGDLLAVALATFAEDAAFRARRIPPPLYVDHDTFALMADGLDGTASPVVGQALRSIAPFARQLNVTKHIRNAALLQLLGRDPAPAPHALIAGTCRELERTGWGRA
jgi:nucleoside-diphosphate-sugar epimerase